MKLMMNNVFLGIGTNLGNREKNLAGTIVKIREKIGNIVKFSSVYETEPWGFSTNDKFLNMVVQVETSLDPDGLLEKTGLIESSFGRIRSKKEYVSRVIDIDILLYDDMEIDRQNLKIPHPHIPERRFVLVPLCELAPDLLHPVLKVTFASLLKSCRDKGKVEKYNYSFTKF